MFDIIAFDADDTLWHNENIYKDVLHKLQHILSRFASPADVEAILNDTEHRNLPYYGFGIKSYILSCLETAVLAANGRLTTNEMHKILGLGKYMVDVDIELLDNVHEIIRELSASHKLMLITKGDLLDQERKLLRSGLAPCFKYVEIVSGKQSHDYAAILERYRIDPSRFLMVGNSLRSDILPVLDIGGQAVHIPYATTWVHEHVPDGELQGKNFHQIENLQSLPRLIEQLEIHLPPSNRPG